MEEAKLYFDQDYFDALIRKADWETVLKYTLHWFSWDGDNFAKKFIFRVVRQMYFEALGR